VLFGICQIESNTLGIYNFGRLKKIGLGLIGKHFYVTPLLRNNSDIEDGLLSKELYSLSPLTFVRKTRFPFLFLNAKFDFHLEKDAEEIVDALKLLGIPLLQLYFYSHNQALMWST
jgi:hypothetical protein